MAALTRIVEEHDLPPDLRRLYAEVRQDFDFPFVPTIFKLLAGKPEYLKAIWGDLAPVAASREFIAASAALQEFVESSVIRGGWQFSDQGRLLAAHKFSQADAEILAEVIGTFLRVTTRMAIFCRLVQRGYSGGQRGRATGAKQAAALSRLVSLHIPSERDASLRAWLIYADYKRVTGAKTVPSTLRILAPWPGYLTAVWVDTKRLLKDPAAQRTSEEISKRTFGLLTGMPVRDHRTMVRTLSAAEWREVEETVDSFARHLPDLALATAVWHRSFPEHRRGLLAA